MMKRYLLALLVVVMFAVPGFAQDDKAAPAGAESAAPAGAVAAAPAVPAAAQDVTQPNELSIYGEVKAVNAAAGTVTVQYYDYDSDEERSIELVVDQTAKLENAGSIADIKQGNWADIIYLPVSGKNVAKSVIVEKEEEFPAETPKNQ